jgi:hypothetical protein
MANAILGRRADTSIAQALAAALKAPKNAGRIRFAEVAKILRAASDGGKITDVEFRDLKRILRTQKLWGASQRLINAHLQLYYPLTGPFVYDKVDELDGEPKLGNHECAALVQSTLHIGLAKTWREGIPVRGNDHLIKKGTAIATFEDGFYANRRYGNHVAYYISQDSKRIWVVDQWGDMESKPRISKRPMRFKGTKSNGLYSDPSNNGDALSVIMRKA